MPGFSLSAASLEAALPVFYQHGLSTAPDAVRATALHSNVTDLTARFPSRELLVPHVMLADMERQKREHVELYAKFPSAVEQVNMLLNPLTFPPDRYNMREVFRSLFLYYIRGICTDEEARVAAEHFARLQAA